MFTSPVRLALIGALIVFLLPLALLLFSNWYSTTARLIVQVSALSERVSFRVTQPNLAAFFVRSMRARSSVAALDKTCVNGLIKPALNSEITFGRVGYGPLLIELHPVGAGNDPGVDASGLLTTMLPEHSTVLSGETRLQWDAGCSPAAGLDVSVNDPPAAPPPLPIWGPLSIGSEFSGYSGTVQTPKLITEGRVTLQARSVAIPFLLARSWYTVSALDLPVGARVEAYATDASGTTTTATQKNGKTGEEATWWGRVYVDPQRPNLVVIAATYTPRLAVYRPNVKEAELVELSSLAQMFGDPNLVVAYKAATSLVVVFALLQFWLSRRTEADRRGGR